MMNGREGGRAGSGKGLGGRLGVVEWGWGGIEDKGRLVWEGEGWR